MDAIMGQTMGGILFSMLAGQPLIVIMTTAPIALYIKIIVAVADVSQTPVHTRHSGKLGGLYHLSSILSNHSLGCCCNSKNLGSVHERPFIHPQVFHCEPL